MSATADELVVQARQRISRIGPAELEALADAGGLIVDIRPVAQRAEEGELPGALVIERNVLEWRLDPSGDHRIPQVKGYEQPVVIVCSEGYASSLAADAVRALGYAHASDLDGGYQAWLAWVAAGEGDPAGKAP
ncbi:MAG TPA: rhodanese-like domain-containing protein [Acidimicrobiales bacterium]|nr:rhodanese-like domain-containing protein [Acidimicrobiales bacterium]